MFSFWTREAPTKPSTSRPRPPANTGFLCIGKKIVLGIFYDARNRLLEWARGEKFEWLVMFDAGDIIKGNINALAALYPEDNNSNNNNAKQHKNKNNNKSKKMKKRVDTCVCDRVWRWPKTNVPSTKVPYICAIRLASSSRYIGAVHELVMTFAKEKVKK